MGDWDFVTDPAEDLWSFAKSMVGVDDTPTAKKKPAPIGQRFKKSADSAAAHSVLGAAAAHRAVERVKGRSQEDISKSIRKEQETADRWLADDDKAFEEVDTFSPANIGRRTVDIVASILAGADPTYAISGPARKVGETAVKAVTRRAATQGGVNAAADAVGQGIEMKQGVRDKYNPVQTGINAAAGVVFQGGMDGASASAARRIARREAVENLDLGAAKEIGDKFGTVTSTVRTPERNKKVGGVPNSYHVRGQAIDVARGDGVTHKQLERAYKRAGFKIIESLDEGDHSHFAFDLKAPKGPDGAEGNGSVRPIDPEELARIMNDPEAAGGLREAPDEAVVGGRLRATDEVTEEADNVVPLKGDAQTQAHKDVDDLLREYEEGPVSRQEVAELREDLGVDRMIADFEAQGAEVPSRVRQIQERLDALYAKGSDLDNAHEKFTPLVERGDAANEDVPPSRFTPEQEAHIEKAKTDIEASQVSPTERLEEVGIGGNRGGGDPPREPPYNGGPSEPPRGGETDDDLVARLTRSIEEAYSVRGEQDELYDAEMSKRVAEVIKRGEYTQGEEGFHTRLGALKGELPKPVYNSIHNQFSQAEIDQLHNMIQRHPTLSPLDKIAAEGGLSRMLAPEGGSVPPESTLKLLSEVFPRELIDAILSHADPIDKFWKAVMNAANLPRTIMSTGDLSMPFRQGIRLIHKKEFWKNIPEMVKQAFSEDYFKQVQAEIRQDPFYPTAKRAGLHVTDLGAFLSNREEDFMSEYAQKIPIFKHVVKFSNRAAIGFLNKLRFDALKSMHHDGVNAGVDFRANNGAALKQLGNFVNSATGRGSLGKLNHAAVMLNATFFSPRLIKSRLDALNPMTYIDPRVDPFVRKEAVKSLLAVSAFTSSLLGLAAMGGADVELDPDDPDFGKIKIMGKTRYEVSGGFAPYVRLISSLGEHMMRVATGKKLKGEKFGERSTADEIGKFFRNKFSPTTSFVWDFFDGTNAIGEPISQSSPALEVVGGPEVPYSDAVISRFTPMFAQDVAENWNEYGPMGAAVAAPAGVGFSVQTYDEKKKGKETKIPTSKEWSFASGGSNDWSFVNE